VIRIPTFPNCPDTGQGPIDFEMGDTDATARFGLRYPCGASRR
jgi:hypothetical protein